MVNHVKRNDCVVLNIARYIDSKPLLKKPPYMQPMQSHQTESCNLFCNLIWGSAAVLQTHLLNYKANVCVICVPDYVYIIR